MKIAFVIANAYGMGGTIRTVFNIAEGLAAEHEVEIISLIQHQKEPFFTQPDGVPIRVLGSIDPRPDGKPRGWIGRWRDRLPTGPVPLTESRRNQSFNAGTERALRTYLHSTDADVVVGTRPGINMMLAKWAPRRVLSIGQEHVHLDNHAWDVRQGIARYYPRLDGLTVLTEADLESYRAFLRGSRQWATTMPNALPPGDYPHSTQENPIIAAAGRLSPIKQYPKLLQAFSVVAQAYPNWRLRIYGGGSIDGKLRTEIADRGLGNQVTLMGRTKDVTGELAKASLLAVSSRAEGFGMTIIEGFSVGVPAVSFDCPHGPREIIDHERNGLLVPPQDVDALAASMMRLVADRDERIRMGREALRSAAAYELPLITRRWERFLTERITAKSGGRRSANAA